MDPRTALKLVERIQELERKTPQIRLGIITDTSPLSVAVGGSDTPYTSVKAIAGIALAVDDVVSVIRFGADLVILGKLGDSSSDATFDTITATGGLVALGGQVSHLNYVLLDEVSDPAPAANKAFIYARDNGAGKTQLCVQFGSGAVQVLATEP